jgi:signal transduction histidine kinase
LDIVTITWSLGAAVAIVLAAVSGIVWLTERRDAASLMLCLVGVGVAASGYGEIAMFHSATPAEYGEWLRWYYPANFLALTGLVLFVRDYLGRGRWWMLLAVVLARALVIVVDFSVRPNFGFSDIISLRKVPLLGAEVSTIGEAVRRTSWQWFAVASLVLLIAYLFDAAVQRWRDGGKDSRRKALAVILGIAFPLLCTIAYTQLLAFGVVSGVVTNFPWLLGALLIMAYELGCEVTRNRRAGLEVANLRVQLAQAERVTALGQLASTLAHELTQPLTANVLNAEVALRKLRGDKPDLIEICSIVSDIDQDSRRGADIVSRMREFFKRRAIDTRPLDLEDVVRDVLGLVYAETSAKHVDISVLMSPRLPRVIGDRVHLAQVLLNLIMNSVQALQSRARDARHIVVEASADDAKGEVEVTVRDSGPGIPENKVDEVFRPFFTTKDDGLGMGLALSRTILEAHGGRLWADCRDGESGAVFHFTLRQA